MAFLIRDYESVRMIEVNKGVGTDKANVRSASTLGLAPAVIEDGERICEVISGILYLVELPRRLRINPGLKVVTPASNFQRQRKI